jgi:hypothetical protein
VTKRCTFQQKTTDISEKGIVSNSRVKEKAKQETSMIRQPAQLLLFTPEDGGNMLLQNIA